MKIFRVHFLVVMVLALNMFNTNSQTNFKEVYQKFDLKQTPICDTTNFDTFKEVKLLEQSEVEMLELNMLYPEYVDQNVRFQPAYRLGLSNDYITLVLHVLKGDHELESVLVNYSKDQMLLQHLVIAYDEIAEGWSRKYASIQNDVITIVDVFYGENKQVDTTKFHINRFGEINELATKFHSDLRPGEQLELNKIYNDAIEFIEYDDNGDYFQLIGKKNGVVISLIYNWDTDNSEKYNFRAGDRIEIEWKMDTIFIAGEGEMMSFSERVIEAEVIK